MATIVTASTEPELNDWIAKNDRKLIALYFEASFAPECQSMNSILEQYGKDVDFSNVIVARIDAEKAEAIASKYAIELVPSFVFIKNGKVIEKLAGFNPPELNRMMKKCLDVTLLPSVQAPVAQSANGATGDLEARLKKLINQNAVMVFIKGSPDAPKCGFSRQIVEILKEAKCSYGYFDILSDETVRQGLKEYSKWPTYPQVYVKGELIGGLDIVKELKVSGELESTLNA